MDFGFCYGVDDVEGVDSSPFFGADFSDDDIQAEFGEFAGDDVEQADAVFGFDFDEGVGVGGLIVDTDDGGDEFVSDGCEAICRGFTFAEERAEIEVTDERFAEDFFELLAFFFGDERAGAGIGDVEGIEDDPVAAGEDLGGENVEADGGEGAGDFAKESGAVPGADLDDGVAAIAFDVPADDGFEGFILFAELVVHESVGLAEVGDDFLRRIDAEVTFGEGVEVGVEFIAAEAARFEAEHFGGEQLALFFLELMFDGAIGEEVAGFVVESKEQAIFEAIPEVVAGAEGVGEGVEGEDGEIFDGLNLFGEGFDDGGVIEISALGDLGHGEVVFDDDTERVSGGAVEVEAACDVDGDDAAEFGVAGFGEGFTGIVEEQSEVEQERTFEIAEDIAVLGEGRFFGFPDLVEFGEADEGMFVCGVLVIELVLDEAGEFAKLGDVFAEETDLVHGPEDGGYVAALIKDFEEGLVDVFVAEEGAIDEGDLVPDHLGEVGAQFKAALLEVEEDAHEASGLIAEDPRGGGGDGGWGDFETVDEQGFGGLGSTAVKNPAEEGDARGGLRGEGETLFEGASDEVEVAEVAVEILHEPLETDARGAVGVAEAVGDGGLDAAGEDVDGAIGLVVQFVAGAEEEVVGVIELACFGVVDELFGFEFLESAGAVFKEGHP